jgi:hypothetical protein
MHSIELEWIIESELREAVLRHYPYDWKEDPVTHDLMIRLRRKLRHIQLHNLRYPIELEWEIYKLHGPRETSHGDVGVLIRYRTSEGSELEGAGFLEAKIRGRDTTRFQQVRHEQVTRLLTRSPQTRLLLYDYNAVPVLDGSENELEDWDFHPLRSRSRRQTQVTHGAVVPMELAATMSHYDDSLYRFCHSLSYQFIQRYFRLHDLDFRSSVVKAVKGFPSDLGNPNYVMIIRVAVIGQTLPEDFAPNNNVYETIGEGQ